MSKVDVDDLLEQSKGWAGYEKYLCNDCKKNILNKMERIRDSYNSDNRIKRKWAKTKLAAMTVTMWRCLCPKCLRKLRTKVGV